MYSKPDKQKRGPILGRFSAAGVARGADTAAVLCVGPAPDGGAGCPMAMLMASQGKVHSFHLDSGIDRVSGLGVY